MCLVSFDICSWLLYTVDAKSLKSQKFGGNDPTGLGSIRKEAGLPSGSGEGTTTTPRMP